MPLLQPPVHLLLVNSADRLAACRSTAQSKNLIGYWSHVNSEKLADAVNILLTLVLIFQRLDMGLSCFSSLLNKTHLGWWTIIYNLIHLKALDSACLFFSNKQFRPFFFSFSFFWHFCKSNSISVNVRELEFSVLVIAS